MENNMSAYMLALVNVTDMEQYKKYTQLTPDIIAEYGGKFIVRGGEKIVLEGGEIDQRIVLVEFPTYQAVQDFYNSEAYQNAKKVRDGASEAVFIALDGVS
jgi:uncharacterized protein (DUF1330 family)